MENARIKEILMDIAPTELDFTVTQTGKESKRVNGLYSPDTHEILLHNKNFKTDNQLIYTAVHEYAHHLNAENLLNTLGVAAVYNAKVHNQAFWARFNELITIAEEKGDFVNNKEAVQKAIDNGIGAQDILGGQNPVETWAESALAIDLSNATYIDGKILGWVDEASKSYNTGEYTSTDDVINYIKEQTKTTYDYITVE